MHTAKPTPLTQRSTVKAGLAAAAGLVLAMLGGWGVAQSVAGPSPSAVPVRFAKPITIVVTFPPGGGTDLLARKLGAELQHSLGQTVLVENRPGASGNIGARHVAEATPLRWHR